MKFKEYESKMGHIWKGTHTREASERELGYSVTYLASECGELAQLILKGIRDKKDVDEDRVKAELGDILWFMVYICKLKEIKLEKITSRFEEHPYSCEDGLTLSVNLMKEVGQLCYAVYDIDYDERLLDRVGTFMDKWFSFCGLFSIKPSDIMEYNYKKLAKKYKDRLCNCGTIDCTDKDHTYWEGSSR